MNFGLEIYLVVYQHDAFSAVLLVLIRPKEGVKKNVAMLSLCNLYNVSKHSNRLAVNFGGD